ncbi:alpha/beta fold hydrolase [Streptomyces sp. NPDC058872]|uniref:alpha/beta fold hydrolase n=1 Tax=Streptomyces sp. NPDC058872 TaxID=3346661 RepID=UPI0036CBC2F0
MTSQQSDTAIHHPEGRHYEVRGRRLWVETEGSGDPVLLLSGLGPAGSHLVFHPFFSALAEDHQVIYVDLFGRGRSDQPAELTDITFREDVADVAALIEALDVGPVHVYGFSYGGLLGQALALDHAGLVRSLVLANSLHSPEMWQLNHANINRELALQAPEVWARIQELRAQGLASTDEELRTQFAAATKLVRFYDPDNASLLLNEPGARNMELYPVFVGADVDFMIGGEVARIPDFRPRLKEITVPTLVLAGRFDRALYPKLQHEFVLHAPQFEFQVLERSGSFGHVEEPETVFARLREFWKAG